jgi:hypothetical protein
MITKEQIEYMHDRDEARKAKITVEEYYALRDKCTTDEEFNEEIEKLKGVVEPESE